MNRSDDKNGIDGDLITETREFIKKGLFSEADCLLTYAVEAEARSIIVGLEWIKISSTQGNHQQAQERLELVKYTHQNVDWSEVEVELLLRARMFERCIEKLTEYRDRSTDIIKWQKKLSVRII